MFLPKRTLLKQNIFDSYIKTDFRVKKIRSEFYFNHLKILLRGDFIMKTNGAETAEFFTQHQRLATASSILTVEEFKSKP